METIYEIIKKENGVKEVIYTNDNLESLTAFFNVLFEWVKEQHKECVWVDQSYFKTDTAVYYVRLVERKTK